MDDLIFALVLFSPFIGAAIYALYSKRKEANAVQLWATRASEATLLSVIPNLGSWRKGDEFHIMYYTHCNFRSPGKLTYVGCIDDKTMLLANSMVTRSNGMPLHVKTITASQLFYAQTINHYRLSQEAQDIESAYLIERLNESEFNERLKNYNEALAELNAEYTDVTTSQNVPVPA